MKRMMKRLVTASVLLVVTFLLVPARAAPPVGSQRPALKLVDGWNRELDLANVRRPLLIVYAGKDSQNQNQTLSAELIALDRTIHYRQTILQIGVAEVDAYNYWPARGLVNEQLQSHSTLSGITIYSDFTGRVRTTLGLTPSKSNVVLYRGDGTVLFSYAGAVPDGERNALYDRIRALVSTP